MSDISNYLENKFLNVSLLNTEYVPPANVYIGLLTSLSSDGDSYIEASGTGYARVEGSFDYAQLGKSTNSSTITFPNPVSDWGKIKYIAIFDSDTNGNILFHDTLPYSISILENHLVNITHGSLSVVISGDMSEYFKNTLLDMVLNNNPISPSSGYIGLISDLSDNGNTYTEITGSGYNRIPLSLTSPEDGTVLNNTDIEFPTATYDYSNQITHIGIFSSATDGSLLYYKSLGTSQSVLEGQILRIKRNTLSISIN